MKVTVDELREAIEALPPIDKELPSDRYAIMLPDVVNISGGGVPYSIIRHRQLTFQKDFKNKCWVIEIEK